MRTALHWIYTLSLLALLGACGDGTTDTPTPSEEGDTMGEESAAAEERFTGPPEQPELYCADCGEVGPCEEVNQDPDTCTCTFTLLTENPCDDGDIWTLEETCSAEGECISGSTDPCDDDDPCTIDSCEPFEGCVHATAENCEGTEA